MGTKLRNKYKHVEFTLFVEKLHLQIYQYGAKRDYKRPLAIFGNGIENEQTAAAVPVQQNLPHNDYTKLLKKHSYFYTSVLQIEISN